jgi:ABC-type phosphate transport system auxiliary subunit
VHMLIEDFKRAVAQLEVGDELKLEALCDKWNQSSPDIRQQLEDLKLENGRVEIARTAVLRRWDEFREHAHAEQEELRRRLRAMEEEVKLAQLDLRHSEARCASLSKEFAREYAHSRTLKAELLGMFEGFVQHMIEYERKKFYELVAEVERRTTDVCLIDRPTGPVKESQCA